MKTYFVSIFLAFFLLISVSALSEEIILPKETYPVGCEDNTYIKSVCEQKKCYGYLTDDVTCKEYREAGKEPIKLTNTGINIPVPKYLNYRATTCNNSFHFYSGSYNINSYTLLSEGDGIIRAPQISGTPYSTHIYCPVIVPDGSQLSQLCLTGWDDDTNVYIIGALYKILKSYNTGLSTIASVNSTNSQNQNGNWWCTDTFSETVNNGDYTYWVSVRMPNNYGNSRQAVLYDVIIIYY